ncbi:MAG: peptidase U32 family protein [Mycoplasmatales bacterium]
MKKPELLAPAGNLEKLKLACIYGADAIYLGGKQYGLRSNSDNFSIEEIKEGVEFAKQYDVKIYVTTNIYAHQENYQGFKEFVIDLEKAGVIGIIVSDPGYIKIAQENTNLEIHISTQHSITNKLAVKQYQKLGYDRVVLARELTFEEIKDVTDNCDIEVEVFIHGAVCSSYSGRCTLSNFMTMRDSNRGGCCQSCRWDYEIYQDNKLIELNKEESLFTMSCKDLNLIYHIPELMQLNVASFKVEGRMKSHHYVATVIKVYRLAIDSYLEDKENYVVKKEWVEEIKKAESRETYEGAPANNFDVEAMIFDSQYKVKDVEYTGIVLDYNQDTNLAYIEERNHFKVGDELEFFGPKTSFKQVINKIYDQDMNEIKRVYNPLAKVYVLLDNKVEANWLIRKEK